MKLKPETGSLKRSIIDKPLTTLTKRKDKKIKITKTRNERGDITIDQKRVKGNGVKMAEKEGDQNCSHPSNTALLS